MRRGAILELRGWLLASLGIAPLACGGQTQTSGTGGNAGVSGSAGAAGLPGPDCADPQPLVPDSG